MGALKDFFSKDANFNFETGEFYFKGLSTDWSSEFSVPDSWDDDDYKFTLNGLSQNFIDRNSKYDSGNLVSLEKLDPKDQWVLLSSENGFVRLDGGVSFEESDYAFLNTPEMITAGTEASGENQSFISFRIANHFKKFNKKETVTPNEIKFFSNYSEFCTDTKTVSELRSKIIKQEGSSDFISEEFGIEDFFTLEDFDEEVAKRIREYIDAKLTSKTPHVFDGKLVWIEDKDGVLSTELPSSLVASFPSQDRHLLRPAILTSDPKGWGYQRGPGDLEVVSRPAGDKTMNSEVYQKIIERTGHLTKKDGKKGWDRITLDERIKQSPLYSDPTKIDDFSALQNYKRNQNGDIDTSYQKHVEFDFYPHNHLDKFYKGFSEPTWLDSQNQKNGFDEVILGFYIKFIYELKTDIKRQAGLKATIGSFYIKEVGDCFEFILRWSLVNYENIIRYSLIDALPKDGAPETDPDALLKEAQKKADQRLEGLKGDTEDEGITEEDIEERIQLYKQCVLLLNMHNLKSDYNKKTKAKREGIPTAMHQKGFYNGRFYMVEDPDDQLAVKNKLISPSGKAIEPFLEVTPDIISALRPRLRFYKIYYDNKAKKTVSFEFPFPSSTDGKRAQTFKDQEIDKGDGVGIKSFNFSFDGETPATSQKYIAADLTIFFQSFQDFVKERTAKSGRSDGADEKFRFIDLFVNTKYCPRDRSSTSPLHYDPSFFRIRVDVGWEPRNDSGFGKILENRGISLSSFNKAINKINKSFYLSLIDHEINISDTGTVTISANYAAYLEELLNKNSVLLSREWKALQDKATKKYEEELDKGKCDDVKLEELRASINAIRVQSRKRLHQSLVQKLLENECLHYVHVESRSRREFTSEKFFRSTPTILKNVVVEAKAEDKSKDGANPFAALKNARASGAGWDYIMSNYVVDTENKNQRISFFYFADLVYFLLDSLYADDNPETEREEQIKVILSSFSIRIPFAKPENHNINLGQIPVEIETFTRWYKEEVVDKELDSISFMDFIKRFAFYLITDIFSEICIDDQQHKMLSFMAASINSVKVENGTTDDEGKSLKTGGMNLVTSEEPVRNIKSFYTNGVLPLQTSAGENGNLKPTDFVQYLLIYPHHRPENYIGRGKALEDAKRGVHHLYIGSSKGLLKNVSFSKTDIPGQRESRMISQGQNGLLQLSSYYRANIKMIGNTIFYPGMLLYLNPFGFGGLDFGFPNTGPGSINNPNLSNIMGIGGYQKVVKVASSISESGKFETTLDCLFEHTGEGPDDDKEGVRRSPGQRTGKGQQNIAKINCTNSKAADAEAVECAASATSLEVQQALLNKSPPGAKVDEEETNE